MKFQEGKFIVRLAGSYGALNETYAFIKIIYRNNRWLIKTEDGPYQEVTDELRDHIIDNMHLMAELKPYDPPRFSKVEVTIRAKSIQGSEHVWRRVNGEALEKLLKCFPDLVNSYWADPNRREKIQHYLQQKHHKKDGKYY